MSSKFSAEHYGLIRALPFDIFFVCGTACLALIAGGLVSLGIVSLFGVILVDIWILAQPHVFATFTRLFYDRESFSTHRAFATWVPIIIFFVVAGVAVFMGTWILVTVYLYWQWYHYVRQSYGIERMYRRKIEKQIPIHDRLVKWMLFAIPLWGIASRSFEQHPTFIWQELWSIPVPFEIVFVIGLVAICLVFIWIAYQVQALIRGEVAVMHTFYVSSHLLIFVVGYLLIDDITHGWLVVNVWHNAQYLIIVWLYNNNRFKNTIHPEHTFLSYISQSRSVALYYVATGGVAFFMYLALQNIIEIFTVIAVPLALVIFQTINFHHYIVDSRIWKMRSKPLQDTLGLMKDIR